eukprot:GHVT01074980.1.p1 GENE.GHVT01074980.1~~GHVT01074980.1.p1  ORF type:complete len:299 (-),score=54.18 GHVT01074980.1:111-1007(-)
MGVDLVYVLTTASAAVPIKAYGPELMVVPVLPSLPPGVYAGSPKALEFETFDPVARGLQDGNLARALQLVDRADAVAVGPGLGTDPVTWKVVERILDHCVENQKPTIVDADALGQLIAHSPKLLRRLSSAILTPNANEFKKLHEHCFAECYGEDDDEHSIAFVTYSLNNPCILLKGDTDMFCDPTSRSRSTSSCVLLSSGGCPKRSGGQGDILVGAMVAWAAWAHQARPPNSLANEAIATAAVGASFLTKEAAASAYNECGRGGTDLQRLRYRFNSFFIKNIFDFRSFTFALGEGGRI